MNFNGLGQIELNAIAPGFQHIVDDRQDELMLDKLRSMLRMREQPVKSLGAIAIECPIAKGRVVEPVPQILFKRADQRGINGLRDDDIPRVEQLFRPKLSLCINLQARVSNHSSMCHGNFLSDDGGHAALANSSATMMSPLSYVPALRSRLIVSGSM